MTAVAASSTAAPAIAIEKNAFLFRIATSSPS
jgi:hypothetical protein